MKKVYLLAFSALFMTSVETFAHGGGDDLAQQKGSIPAPLVQDAESLNTIFTTVNTMLGTVKQSLEITVTFPLDTTKQVIDIVKAFIPWL